MIFVLFLAQKYRRINWEYIKIKVVNLNNQGNFIPSVNGQGYSTIFSKSGREERIEEEVSYDSANKVPAKRVNMWSGTTLSRVPVTSYPLSSLQGINHMDVEFFWTEDCSRKEPYLKISVKNDDGFYLLACLLSDDGGMGYKQAMGDIYKGIHEINLIKEGKQNFLTGHAIVGERY